MKEPKYPKFKDHTVVRRKFLNKKEGLGAIQTYVSLDSDSISASVELMDCNRKISLDFYFYEATEKNLKEKLAKLDILINTLNEFRNDLIWATEEIRCRQPLYDAYRVEKKAWKLATNQQNTTLEDLLNQ